MGGDQRGPAVTAPGLLMRAVRRAAELAGRTVRETRSDRATGAAAEVAFFLLLSLPPMLLVLAGAAGYVAGWLGSDTQRDLQQRVIDGLGTFLSPDTMADFVGPAVENLFERGRADILSVGALIALWSASRVVRVLIEALNAVYDIEMPRAGWRRRILALQITAGGIAAGAVVLPFVVAGPELGVLLADRTGLGFFEPLWAVLYWPVAAAAAVGLLTTLYHVAPNWKTPWARDVPGAVLAATVWIAAAFALRVYVANAFEDNAFGPLAAPAVLMLWFWISALAILVGAELNAEIEKEWPTRPDATVEAPDAPAPAVADPAADRPGPSDATAVRRPPAGSDPAAGTRSGNGPGGEPA